MKNKHVFIITAVLFLFGTAQAFAQKKEVRDVESFTSIGMSVHGDLYLKQGSPQKVEIEADEKTLERVVTVVKDGKLKIKFDKPGFSSKSNIKIWVTVPEIEGLYMAGSGNIIAEDEIQSDEMEISVSGSGNMKIKQLTSDEVSMAVSGSGDITIGGTGDEMDVSISGSGKVDAEQLKVEECSVAVSGSGNCTVNVSKELEAAISGSGKVYYAGNPQVNAKVSGSGKVQSLD